VTAGNSIARVFPQFLILVIADDSIIPRIQRRGRNKKQPPTRTPTWPDVTLQRGMRKRARRTRGVLRDVVILTFSRDSGETFVGSARFNDRRTDRRAGLGLCRRRRTRFQIVEQRIETWRRPSTTFLHAVTLRTGSPFTFTRRCSPTCVDMQVSVPFIARIPARQRCRRR